MNCYLLCYLLFLCFALFLKLITAELWCYSCVSSEPGCNEFYVDWRIHHTITCPRDDDKCVKIIERKGVEKFITRDCLSNLESMKNDIPADRYDGCRKAAEQPKLAVYVENHITELEFKSPHYDDVTYCFCEYDQFCNKGLLLKINKLSFVLFTIFYLFINFLLTFN